MTDFHLDRRSTIQVFRLGQDNRGREEVGHGVDTGIFRKLPIIKMNRKVVHSRRRQGRAQAANRRMVFIRGRKTGNVLSFGIGTAMVRMGVVLVADTIHEGYIPGVHTEEIVHVRNRKIKYFVRLPVLNGARLRHRDIFQILRHVVIGQEFKNIGRLVLGPPLLSIDRVCNRPHRVVRNTGPGPAGLACRKDDCLRATRHDATKVCGHGQGDIFDIIHSLLARKAERTGLILRFQDQLVKGVQGARIYASPVRGGVGFQERSLLVRKPPAIEHSRAFLVAVDEILLGLPTGQGRFFHGIVQVGLVRRCVEKAYRRKAHLVMVSRAAAVSR